MILKCWKEGGVLGVLAFLPSCKSEVSRTIISNILANLRIEHLTLLEVATCF